MKVKLLDLSLVAPGIVPTGLVEKTRKRGPQLRIVLRGVVHAFSAEEELSPLFGMQGFLRLDDTTDFRHDFFDVAAGAAQRIGSLVHGLNEKPLGTKRKPLR